MGLKRIMFVAEATFPVDDSRSLTELTEVTAQGVADGLIAQNGALARIGITGAAADPDPELPAEDVPATPPPAESGDPVIP